MSWRIETKFKWAEGGRLSPHERKNVFEKEVRKRAIIRYTKLRRAAALVLERFKVTVKNGPCIE